jgi:hypothetical protein
LWVGAVVEEVGEEVDAVADVAGVVVVDVEGVGAGDGGGVAEEVVEEIDHIAQLDRSIGVGIATDEVYRSAGVWDSIVIIVGTITCGDVALIGGAVVIAVFGNSQQDVALIEDAVAVAVGIGEIFAPIGDLVLIAVGSGPVGSLATVYFAIIVAVIALQLACVGNAIAVTIRLALIWSAVAVAIE